MVCVFSFFLFLLPWRRKSKVRRSKSRYKMLEADEQDSLELHPPRAGETHPRKITVTNSTDFRSVFLCSRWCMSAAVNHRWNLNNFQILNCTHFTADAVFSWQLSNWLMLYFQCFWGLRLQLKIISFLSIIIFSNNWTIIGQKLYCSVLYFSTWSLLDNWQNADNPLQTLTLPVILSAFMWAIKGFIWSQWDFTTIRKQSWR